MRRSCMTTVAASVLVAIATAARAQPDAAAPATDAKAACLAAVGKGQKLRDAHRLVEAREQFRLCARPACPAVLQNDCTSFLADVERRLPTVVLAARDAAGRDVIDVRVSVDGHPLASSLDGRAVPVDPGPHTFVFEGADGAVAREQVLVTEGEQARRVAVVLGAPAPPPGAPAGGEPAVVAAPGEPSPASRAASGETAAPVAASPGQTARTVGLVLAGAGVVALGVGAVMAIDAKGKDDRAAGESGAARQTDSQAAVGEANTATVVLGAGVALAAAGAVLWLTAPHASAASVSQRTWRVGIGGRGLVVSGSF